VKRLQTSTCLALLLALTSCRQPGTSATLSDILAAPLGLDFGAVALGRSVTKSVELSNSGRGSLQVEALDVLGANGARFTLDTTAPFELVDPVRVTVTYTPTRAGLDVGQLIVRSNAQNTGNLQIALSGVGVVTDGGQPGADGGLDAGAEPDAGTSPDAGRPPRDAGFFADDSGCPPTWASGTEATAYQVDSAHTGAQPDDRLTLPLCERWRRDLGAPAGYPVVSGGLVYVVSASSSTSRQLWALDQYTGVTRWGPMVLTGTYWWLALTVGNGTVFALSDSGALVAFDALTGQQRWISQVGRSDSAPTVTPAGLFVSVDLAVKGIDPGTGATRWTRPVVNGDTSSPAVSGNFFSVSYACNQAYGFSTVGTQLWHATSSCSGGGGKTTALYRGRVYTRDFNGQLILAAANGGLLGAHSSTLIPAFSGDLGLYSNGSGVQAVSLLSGQVLWTGPGAVAAPLVVGAHVVVPASGAVVVLDAQTGAEVSRATLASIRGVDEQNVSAPLAGMSAANGMLFVPAGTSIVAY
jgi:outer membrane protein assembly factor BamB